MCHCVDKFVWLFTAIYVRSCESFCTIMLVVGSMFPAKLCKGIGDHASRCEIE